MKSRIRIAGLVASTIILSVTAANAAAIYTVAENPVMDGGITDIAAVNQAAQTFTPLDGGELASISVYLGRNGPLLPAEVLIDIRGTSGGKPGPILATASIPTNSIGLTRWYELTADFSSYHINLNPGLLYAFSLRAPAGDLGHADAAGSGDKYPDGSSYYTLDSGNSWVQQTGYDLTFTVTAIPEPSATALTGFAGLIILLTRAAKTKPFTRQLQQGCSRRLTRHMHWTPR